MDIAEVTKLSGLPASTLRYYEQLGLITSIGRSGLRRQYAPNVLEKLNLISLGRLAGFSLNDIAAMLATSSQDMLVIDREMLSNKAQEIDAQIKRLKAVRDSLNHVANCPHSSHLTCPSFQKLMKSVKRHLPELKKVINAMNDFDKISSPIEARISTGFAKINTAMRSKAWEHAAANGLTPTQTEILSLLAVRSVPLRLSAIAQQLAITPATASDAVAALVTKGLIAKGPAIDDKRALSITLTEAGSSMAASANLSLFLGSATQMLSENEKVMLLRLIIKMVRQLQDQGDIALNRMCVTCQYFGKNQEHSVSQPHYCHLVNAPFGDQHLRLDCPEHEEAQLAEQLKT